MKTEKTIPANYLKAKKRLNRLKSFYTHLSVYFIVNIVLFVVYFNSKNSIFHVTTNKEVINWADWNVLLTSIIWGAFLIVYAFCVFQWRFPFLKRWEERQLKKIMEKENQGI
jgi:uncharacterized membrane protein YhaH (DUF805 family)